MSCGRRPHAADNRRHTHPCAGSDESLHLIHTQLVVTNLSLEVLHCLLHQRMHALASMPPHSNISNHIAACHITLARLSHLVHTPRGLPHSVQVLGLGGVLASRCLQERSYDTHKRYQTHRRAGKVSLSKHMRTNGCQLIIYPGYRSGWSLR